jgi:hypothetical protein
MDSCFRAILLGTHVGFLPDTKAEDIAAIEWAVETFRLLAGNAPLQASEDDLRVETPAGPGTADGACPEKLFSVDLKTGQVRNYFEQMAAYALGFMEREFCEQWTTHLLFCDEREIVTFEWTQASALAAVQPVIAAAKDPESLPTPCDYCGWCALRWTCAARLEPLSMLLTGAPDKLDLNAIKACPADLGRLMDITYLIAKEDGLHDELREAAKDYLLKSQAVPGWSLQNGRKTETVPALQIAESHGGKCLLTDAGTQRLSWVISRAPNSPNFGTPLITRLHPRA